MGIDMATDDELRDFFAAFAMNGNLLDKTYTDCWSGLKNQA